MAHGDIEKYTKDAEDALAEASRKVDSGLPRSSYLANVGIANAILVLTADPGVANQTKRPLRGPFSLDLQYQIRLCHSDVAGAILIDTSP